MKEIYLRNLPGECRDFSHTDFFLFLFSFLKPENYLELGVRDGSNFRPVSPLCKKSTAVDIIPIQFPIGANCGYFQMSTDTFFEKLDKTERYDAVFIDADHSHAQSLKDFLNVKDLVVEDGFIFLHDTYPYDESWIVPVSCGDVYKTALYIKQNFLDEFEIVTLPFNPGLTIIKKMKKNKQLIYK